MDFKTLHETIPYAKGGKEKVLRYSPYPNITLAMPGRHALATDPIGGDFVVMVNDPVWNRADHQFTHTDIFSQVEYKHRAQPNPTQFLMEEYLRVVKDGKDPVDPNVTVTLTGIFREDTMQDITFLHAVQCLAVAEHRRYAKYEGSFGGRYLPFRFAAGIAEGLWTAADAANLQKRGRPGVEILEHAHGIPVLSQELMGTQQ